MKDQNKVINHSFYSTLSGFIIISLFCISSKTVINHGISSIKKDIINQDKKGSLSRDYWKNFQDELTSLSALIDFGMRPSKSQSVPSGSDKLLSFEAVSWNDNSKTSNWDDNYAQRIYGYLVPEVSGSYKFFVAAKDASELWLSDSEDLSKIQRIGGGNGSNAHYFWP